MWFGKLIFGDVNIRIVENALQIISQLQAFIAQLWKLA